MRRKLITLVACLCAFASVFAETNYKVSTASRLNVRKAPSTSGTLLGTFKSGEEITVLSITNGWAKVKYGKAIGYVSAKYIEELPKKVKEEPQKVEEVIEVEEIVTENNAPIYEVVSQNLSSSISTPVTFGSSMPSSMNLYLAAQGGFGWSNFLWSDGSVNGTMAYSGNILAQLYFEGKVSFIPQNWYSEIALGYNKLGAADFDMNYIHLGLCPFGYRVSLDPINIVVKAGVDLSFPLNDLETNTNSWSADLQCGVLGGLQIEWKQFAVGCNAIYDFTEVSSSCSQKLNNIGVLGTITYKFGKFGHK